MKISPVLFGLIGLATATSADACYTVYRQNDVIYQSTSTPVDLSLSLSESVPDRFGPGTTMVTSIYGDDCRRIDARPEPAPGIGRAARARNARLLSTDIRRENSASTQLLMKATPVAGNGDISP